MTVARPAGDISRFRPDCARDRRCAREIKLGAVTYQCARWSASGHEHDGIHDANVRHDDGGLVRW